MRFQNNPLVFLEEQASKIGVSIHVDHRAFCTRRRKRGCGRRRGGRSENVVDGGSEGARRVSVPPPLPPPPLHSSIEGGRGKRCVQVYTADNDDLSEREREKQCLRTHTK